MSAGLYCSVENRMVCPCRHAVCHQERQRYIPPECRVRGVYDRFYRAMHPDEMRFSLLSKV